MQKQKQAKHQGKRTQVENGASPLAAPSAAANALKGYNLTSNIAAQDPTSNSESAQPQLDKAQDPAALVHHPSRKGHKLSGKASHAQIQQHSRPASKLNVPHTSNIGEKRDNFARRAKRDRAAFEGKPRPADTKP